MKAIAEQSGAALTIVGDDDQAIFEWRGGAPTYLLEPESEFDREFKTFALERNYRCPRNLVAADYAGALSSMFAAKTGEEAIRVIRSRFEALHQDFGRGATDIFLRDPATTELQASEVVTYLSSRG